MGKFDGKKLLVLGTSVGSIDIVTYAKKEGAYVIVTDNLPTEKSVAKQYADETAMISTLDVDALCEFAKEQKVDGVFCGVSERNLLSVNAVAKKLDLPCYFTKEQWDLYQDKAQFKKLCEKFDIPVAQKFDLSDKPTLEELAEIKYPVIVKPADRSSCIGVHICNNQQELIEGYKDAYEESLMHKVVVEQYMIGDEFNAAYTFADGEYRLSTMGDKYLNGEQNGLTPIPEAYVYPSKYLDMYVEKISPKVIKMLKSTGLANGTVFIQGVTDGKNFALFEAGLRMGGFTFFRYANRVNGVNILELLVDYSLTGKMDLNLNLEDPNLKGKHCCTLSMLNSGGKICKISGVEEASKVNGVIRTEIRYKEGDTILKSGTIKQSCIVFFIVRDSVEELKESIEIIQDLVTVTDNRGKNMLLSRFDAAKLLN